ncbi:MAG: tetratricopeptide repeat protein [Verrucomicrobium sp.]|nr:tetratricopeptide repeat protein [Verrucomicrobium sp.]
MTLRRLSLVLFVLAAAGLPARADAPSAGQSVTPNELLVQAHKLYDRSDYDLAKAVLDKLITRPGVERPVLAEAIFWRARIAQQTDQLTDAVVWYQRYLTEFSDQIDAAPAAFQLGETYKQLGAYDRARDAFYKTLTFAINRASSLTLDDFSISVRISQAATWELAETEYLASNWQRADELYERFKKQNPSLEKLVATASYRQGDISFQLRQPKEAIARYESALALAPFHPFATEAWLRLVSLYGMTNQPQKQKEALQSFIWLVDTLDKDNQLYWQRRCADQLLSEYKGHLKDQIPLLETIYKSQNNPGWARMLDFYLSLLARQTNDPNADQPQPSAEAADSWNDWLRGFRERLAGLVAKMEAMRDKDSAVPVTAVIVPVTPAAPAAKTASN